MASRLYCGLPNAAPMILRDLLAVHVDLEFPATTTAASLDRVRAVPRRKQREVLPVAAIHGQLLHLPRIDVAAVRDCVTSISAASPVTVTDSCTRRRRHLHIHDDR